MGERQAGSWRSLNKTSTQAASAASTAISTVVSVKPAAASPGTVISNGEMAATATAHVDTTHEPVCARAGHARMKGIAAMFDKL